MSSMEAEIAEKDRQLTALREENSSLAGRNAVLEKVLALREEQLKQQQGGAVDSNQVCRLSSRACWIRDDALQFASTMQGCQAHVAHGYDAPLVSNVPLANRFHRVEQHSFVPRAVHDACHAAACCRWRRSGTRRWRGAVRLQAWGCCRRAAHRCCSCQSTRF
jgi:hypothetical protein